jgi:hypothetical protein
MLEPSFICRKDWARVAQPQRQGRRAELAGDEPRHRHRPFADQRDNVAAAVGELKEAAPLLHAEAEVEHVHVLDKWRDDVAITPAPHLGEQRFLGFAQDLGFERKEVAKSRDPA